MQDYALFRYTTAELRALPAENFAGPNRTYPIKVAADVANAWNMAGMSKTGDTDAIRAKVVEIAKRLGLEKALPSTAHEPATHGANMQESFELGRFEIGENSVTYRGKVFEAGSYEAQAMDVTADEVAAACEAFTPVPVRDTHREDQSVFAGKLGAWTSARYAEQGAVEGTLKVPRPLLALLGSEFRPKVSVEIDRATKRFTAVALVNFPQVTDAQVAAAFAGARHSQADLKAIQQIHDVAVSQGAQCTPATHGRSTDDGAPKRKRTNMTTIEKIKAFFSADPGALEEAGINSAEVALLGGSPAVPPDLQARFDAHEAELAKLREREVARDAAILRDRGAAFARELIEGPKPKALPSQRDELIALFTAAAQADGNGSATFGADGALVEGAAVKALRSMYDKQPPIRAFAGMEIPNAAPVDGAAAFDAARSLRGAVDMYNRPATAGRTN